jgi:tape measure domain-containing protein
MEGGDLRMSSIDERVVQMQFDNKQFESGIKTTLTSLDALNKGLKLEGATKGLNDVSNAASKFSLAHISDGVDAIASKFKAFSIIGITALTNVATKAISVGQNLVSSLTVDPIKAGLSEYETNLNAIQTILSNTQWQHTGLADVNAALQVLNTYSDKTIYNFSEMARNIGTFTAAGVDLNTSVNAIKGIANLAAISGSSAEQASTAMYQLSQALATGTLHLQDWNSVVNAGMGGKVFQDALIETARVHGVAVDKIIKDEGSFRDSLQKGWLTSSILTETLNKFTGDLTASQLKAMGYNDQQIVGILKMGKTAQDAATKVKTFSQLLSTLQEAAGSGWTNTWQIIFGDFGEAEDLFTNVNNVLSKFISASAQARNKVLQDWKDLGGRTALIHAIGNAFNDVLAVIKPVKDAFREIFPAVTGKQLADISKALEKFTANLKIGGTTANEIKRTFAGVFSILKIGVDVVEAIATNLLKLFGVATQGSGGILKFTANVGDMLVAFKDAVEQGHALEIFFGDIEKILAVPIKLLKTLGTVIAGLFSGFNSGSALSGISKIGSKLAPIQRVIDAISSGGDKLDALILDIGKHLPGIIDKVIGFFGRITDGIEQAFAGVNWGTVLKGVNTGLFAGLVVVFKQLVDKFKSSSDGSGGLKDLVSGIKDSFDELTKTLSTMQNTLRAATLLEIAAAISLLTISVVALSKIDAEGLTRALTAMSIMFIQLFTSMAVFQKIVGSGGFAKMSLVTGAMILLAIAVDLLTIAVKNLAGLSWEELAKGLTGLSVILGGLAGAMRLMPSSGTMISNGLGLIALAAGIKILVSAVTDLSGFSWEELAKGLAGVAGLLVSLALFTKFSDADKGGIAQGVGIILLATGIKILASAVSDFAKLSWAELGKGLAGVAGGLVLIGTALDALPPTSVLSGAAVLLVAASLSLISDAIGKMGGFSWGEIGRGLTTLAGALGLIAVALDLMPPSTLLSAAAILIVAVSLGKITDALGKMGGMSWTEIAKGLIVLAGSLGIIAAAMILMTEALPGAAALLVVAASLAILTPILIAMGNMSWESIAKGLLTLAGVFTILGIAGLVLTPLVPTLIGLGLAVALLGVGMLAAGAGVLAFSIGLSALAVAGTAGAAALVGIVAALIGLIPLALKEVGEGIVAFAGVIAQGGPAITGALVAVLLALIDAIAILTPKIVTTLYNLAVLLLDTLVKFIPKLVDAGYKMLIGILNGIANNIGKVITAATNVAVNFLNGISNNLPRVEDAGVKMIISFVNGLANSIRNNTAAMRSAGLNLAMAIIDGMTGGLASGAGKVANAAKNAAKAALNAAKNFLGINSPSKEFFALGEYSGDGMAGGFDSSEGVVVKSVQGMANAALNTMAKSLSDISDLVSDNIDPNPTITPVLDLTELQKNAGQIDKVLAGTKQISLKVSTAQATTMSNAHPSNQPPPDNGDEPGLGGDVIFNQNNYSPKALDAVTVYRQTKNQLSVAKEALK